MLPLSFSSSADGRIELTGPEPDSVSRLMNLKVGIPPQLSVIVNGGSFVVSIIASRDGARRYGGQGHAHGRGLPVVQEPVLRQDQDA